ncbi:MULTISPECIES: nitric oxide reductase activation protein NorD [unclassified Leptospira]|uniref:nitric oxide reductase activation protein NorD n=1 Tax=unclassified Leptospira TaxID=2633828 RepID=UPI0002BE4BA8|nr:MULTISPECIES: VWA domain-containing protein [unclassified Leptospira]EMK02019.1 von Willebrand factor type A domain protein [Leptospira sp. B5-022]MCR1795248.1 VWA domain-containing protein [Leptospira sp. id769339]
MGWEEFIFKKTYNTVREIFSSEKDPSLNHKIVKLSEFKPRLSVLAKSLTGENIEISPAEKEGGFQDQVFFLPGSYSHGPDISSNLQFYIFRILYISEQRKLGFYWKKGENKNREESLKAASRTYPQVLASLEKNYPEAKSLIESVENTEKEFQRSVIKNKDLAEDLSLLHGIWMSSSISKLENRISSQELLAQKAENDKIETEIEGVARERIETIQADLRSQEDYTLMHQFEKVETAEEFQGNWRDFDGSDTLSEQEEAIRELDLRHTVRSNEPTHSVFRTDLFSGLFAGEVENDRSEENPISYDEWDFKKRKYRKDHCKVFPKKFPDGNRGFAQKIFQENHSTLNSLRSRMNRFYNLKTSLKRQPYGEDLDLDAALQYFSDLSCGQTPSENVYLSDRKKLREVSILLLADMSLSTDSYVANQRILDVEKTSLVLFGQICSEFGDRFRIDSFYSNTRNHCDYSNIKSFDEPWERSRERIGLMEAKGYTRIGPAIRHSLSLIQTEKTQKRWILLLTDGKPNDYDRYEGKYGIEDVKKAIQECERSNVGVFALAIDKSAKQYLPAMLGKESYRILPNPKELPEALTDFFIKLVR